MKRPNILFICADEHTRSALNCYGATFIRSPNLDRLAAMGARFTCAYSNSPLCVPARASLITGQYVHQTRCWDNGHPYHGHPPGWAHRLRSLGYHTVSIGKNHFRSSADDNGFEREMLPMHVRDGIGDLFGMLRKDALTYPAVSGSATAQDGGEPGADVVRGPAIMADAAGPGESNHTRYDREITAEACEWLRDASRTTSWALYVSLVAPHFPLIAPEEFYDLYTLDRIPKPSSYSPSARPTHPVVRTLTRVWNFDDYFDEEKILRARAGYYGLVSFLDFNIGKILAALDDGGQSHNTVIVYTSDHGEMLGNKGIWSTSALYEDSVGVPLIMSGPNIKAGSVVTVPVSHVDIFPTLTAIAADTSPASGPGKSLLTIARSRSRRAILSEYHAGGSITGCFMLRLGRWKYHYYVGYPPELFDIRSDPKESRDLAMDPSHTAIRAQCETALRKIVDPDGASALAFADQAATISRFGGVEAVRGRSHSGEHALDRQLGVE